mmetsp:Transcript_15521/g.60710  ORF Transcript_15521/g.60710 Transcript_15521/m.60710 type:complete len:224 (+) Transcript_15521:678-1349(+)
MPEAIQRTIRQARNDVRVEDKGADEALAGVRRLQVKDARRCVREAPNIHLRELSAEHHRNECRAACAQAVSNNYKPIAVVLFQRLQNVRFDHLQLLLCTLQHSTVRKAILEGRRVPKQVGEGILEVKCASDRQDDGLCAVVDGEVVGRVEVGACPLGSQDVFSPDPCVLTHGHVVLLVASDEPLDNVGRALLVVEHDAVEQLPAVRRGGKVEVVACFSGEVWT